jgi:hypothetical protein
MKVTGATTLGVTTITTSSSTALLINSSASSSFIGMVDSSGSFTYLGSDNGAMLFQTPASSYSTKMTLDNTGNLGLGVTPSAWYNTGNYVALQVGNASLFGRNSTNSELYLSSNVYDNVSGIPTYITTDFATRYEQNDGVHIWRTAPSGTAGNAITFTQAMTLTAAGRLLLNQTSDTGEQLQVTGTMKVTGNDGYIFIKESGGADVYLRSAYGGTNAAIQVASASPLLFITNNTERSRITSAGNTILAYTGSDSGEKLQVNGTAKITGATTLTTSSAGSLTAKIRNEVTSASANTGYGLAIESEASAASSYALTIRNLAETTTYFHVSTATGIVGNVGINTISPSEKLHVAGNMLISGANSFKMRNLAGTDVNVIRAVSGGTSVLSTATLGNNIAIGTQSAHDFLLCSSDTERIRLSSSGWFSHTNATNPSSSVTDSYVQYSADVTAGNAAPHFRTENGAVIKLYQETTAVGNSIISLGGGNSVLDDTTFDGYTLRQIVKALRNQGILA